MAPVYRSCLLTSPIPTPARSKRLILHACIQDVEDQQWEAPERMNRCHAAAGRAESGAQAAAVPLSPLHHTNTC